MALNYTLTDIENYETVCWVPFSAKDPSQKVPRDYCGRPYVHDEETGGDKVISAVTQTLIFAMAGLGVGPKITKKNVDEVVKRLAIWQRIRGPLLYREETNGYLTRADVEAHIGLHCNVGRASLAAFKKSVWRELDDSVEWLEGASR